MKTKLEILSITLFITIIINGCGFYSFTGASIPPEAETVSISHFPNHAQIIQPTLSQRFREDFQDKFMRETNLDVIESGGDLHFEGAITGYSIKPVSVQADDKAAQNRLEVTIRVTFENNYDPDSDFERNFSRYYDYPSNKSLSQIEDDAINIINEEIVDDIFNQSVVNW